MEQIVLQEGASRIISFFGFLPKFHDGRIIKVEISEACTLIVVLFQETRLNINSVLARCEDPEECYTLGIRFYDVSRIECRLQVPADWIFDSGFEFLSESSTWRVVFGLTSGEDLLFNCQSLSFGDPEILTKEAYLSKKTSSFEFNIKTNS